jgi:hypothetical protein
MVSSNGMPCSWYAWYAVCHGMEHGMSLLLLLEVCEYVN